MYQFGRGLPSDHALAVQWYRRAAEQSNAEGQHALGMMYANGRGVPRDDVEAARWFRRSADQGSPLAQHILGLMYLSGRGVTRDLVASHMWCDLAGRSADDRTLPEDRAAFRHCQTAAAGQMSASQRDAARRLADAWRSTSP